MYCAYRNEVAAAYLSNFYFIFYLSMFFVTLSLRNCEAYKVETWYTCAQWVDVSYIPESGCCCLFISLFFTFLSLLFSGIKIFLGTMRPRRLKLHTNMNNGWMYCVYRHHAAAAYSSLQFFIFLSVQFSNIIVLHISLQFLDAHLFFSSDSAIAGL